VRRITIPRYVLETARASRYAVLEWTVAVDWPELRLTEDQIVANAVALANGHPSPYPDHSIISIVLPAGEAKVT
jgi:hypothetical protein